MVASSVTTEPINHVYEPLFGLVVQGAKRILLGDRMLDYGAGQYLVVSVDLPITSHIDVASAEEPFLSIGLMLKPAAISTLLLDAATNDRAAVAPSGIGVSEAPVELLEAVVRLLRLLVIRGTSQEPFRALSLRFRFVICTIASTCCNACLVLHKRGAIGFLGCIRIAAHRPGLLVQWPAMIPLRI